MQMLHKFKTLAATLCLAAAVLIAAPALVGAAPVDVLQDCEAASTVCQGQSGSTVYTILKNIINLLLTLVGIISVIMIIIGGIRYATSSGDASQAKSARDTIVFAVVGLVVAVMAFAIVNWVLVRLNQP